MKRIWVSAAIVAVVLWGIVGLTSQAVEGQTRVGPWGRHGLVPADTLDGVASKTYVQDQISFPSNQFPPCATDFLTANAYTNPPWFGAGIASGTATQMSGLGNHPGMVSFRSSSSANSGYTFRQADGYGFLIAGTEVTEFVFEVIMASRTTTKMGFLDVFDHTNPVDGVWLDIYEFTLQGKVMSNSVGQTTYSAYTIQDSTWYRGKIVVKPSAIQANYYLYDAAGTSLWADSLMNGLPTATGRETGHGIVATNSGTTAVYLIGIDFMNLYMTRTLVR